MLMSFHSGSMTPLARLNAGIGQADAAPIAAPPKSFEEVWQHLYGVCEGIMGEENCRKLLGWRPFVCPPPREQAVREEKWKYLLIGAAAGFFASKLVRL